MSAAADEIGVRAAVPADGAAIAALIAEHVAEEGAEEGAAILGRAEDYAAGLAQGRCACLVAERGGRPLGLLMFYRTFSSWSGRPGLFVEDLYLRPEARQLGLGRRLLAALARIAAAEGCDRIDLVVQENNPARAFYARLGWRELPAWRLARADAAAIAALARAGDPDPV